MPLDVTFFQFDTSATAVILTTSANKVRLTLTHYFKVFCLLTEQTNGSFFPLIVFAFHYFSVIHSVFHKHRASSFHFKLFCRTSTPAYLKELRS